MEPPRVQPNRLSIGSREELTHFERLQTPLWIFDVDRHCMWWANATGLAFWQANCVDALIGRDFSSDSAAVRDRLRQIVSQSAGTLPSEDAWTLYPGGTPVSVLVAYQPVELEAARDALLVEIREILEPPPDVQSWRLREAVLATPLMITSLSANGKVLSQNPAATACYGATFMAGTAALHDRMQSQEVADSLLTLALRDETLNWQVQVETTAGAATHLVSPRRSRDPVTGEFVIILSEMPMTDLAALIESQVSRNDTLEVTLSDYTQRLRASEERYARAVETAAVWDWDIQNDRLYLSPKFVSWLGYSDDELKDILREKTFLGFVHEEDVPLCIAASDMSGITANAPLSAEFRLIRKSGEPVWFSLQGTIFVDGEGAPKQCSGLLTNIMQRKELEQRLLVSQRLEAIGQLTGGVAHEFNNLLTVVLGNAELMLETDRNDPVFVSEIINAAQRGADLTRHMLAFARKQPLTPTIVDLMDLVPRVSTTLLRVLGETITVEHAIDEALWPVYADGRQIEAALLNVALNARDAMPAGGAITITCRNFSVTAEIAPSDLVLRPGDYVELDVKDTGAGMPAETAARAFEPFFTTKEVGKGSGLGLSMVQGFTRQSGGDAQIRSQTDSGTRVSLFLPRAAQQVTHSTAPMPASTSPKHGATVHVLEDDSQVSGTVAHLLSSLGYDVTLSHSYDAAIAQMEGRAFPDLFLVDVVLPGGRSGLEFATWVRQRDRSARIVLMTGFPGDLEGKDGADPALRHILKKPFTREALSRALARVIEGA